MYYYLYGCKTSSNIIGECFMYMVLCSIVIDFTIISTYRSGKGTYLLASTIS